MFRAVISPILRSTRLCVTACAVMHPRCGRPVAWMRFHPIQATGRHCHGCIIPQAVKTQSSAPDDGRNHRPKHVELTGINNKPLLLHPVGCLCYCISDARSSKHQISALNFKVHCFSSCLYWTVVAYRLIFLIVLVDLQRVVLVK
jgi:hypothetical protein